MLEFPFQRFPFAAFTLHGVVLGHWLITPMKVAPPEKRVNICQHLKNGFFELMNTAPTAAARPPIPSTGTRLPRPPTAAAATRKGWSGSLWKTFYTRQHHHLKFVLEQLALPKTAPPPMITELGSTPLQLLAQASVFPSESWKKHSGSKSWRSSSWPCRCRCCRHTPPLTVVYTHPRRYLWRL